MRCFIIRHAEKESGDFYNPHLRHQDQPISQKGRLDSQKLSSFFRETPIAAIYVSTYLRTRQTIEHLARQLQLVPTVDERLNEIDNGLIEDMTEQEIQAKFPVMWKSFVERTADFRFPEGETGEEAQQRLVAFIREKEQSHHAQNILLVSHDGLMRLLMCFIMHAPVYERWNLGVDPCGMMEITYEREPERWKAIRFNQTCI